MVKSSALGRSVRGRTARNLRVGVIREPGGRVIAEVYQEGSLRVLVRHVKPRPHLFRARDAWPLGAHALKQALDLGVDVLRYIAPDGTYQVCLAEFVARAERVLGAAREVQYVLPRSRWHFTPHLPATAEQLALEIGA